MDTKTINKNANAIAQSIQRIFINHRKYFSSDKMRMLPERYL